VYKLLIEFLILTSSRKKLNLKLYKNSIISFFLYIVFYKKKILDVVNLNFYCLISCNLKIR